MLAGAGCSGDGDDEAGEEFLPATTTTSAPASASTTSTTVSAPELAATDLANGRHPGRLTAIDARGRTLTVDIVQFLSGDAATKAAAEDGGEAANDYWIRNQNPRLRTLPVTADAPVTVNTLKAGDGDNTDDEPSTLEELATLQYKTGLFWLTVANGKVVKLEEQYLP